MYTQVYGQQPKKLLVSSKQSGGAKRKMSSMNIVARIPRQMNYNKPNLNEIKYADLASSDDNFFVIGSFAPILLNGLTQGAAQQQRIGNKIAMKSIRVRGQVINLLTAVQTYARIIVYYDKQCNGANCLAGDLLATTTTGLVSASTVFSELNLQNVERFQILRDYTIVLPSVTNTVGVLTNVGFDSGQTPTGESIFNVDMFIKLKGLQTLYKGATNAVGDVATGGLFMVCLNHQGVGAWTFRNTERLRYNDN